LKNNLKKIKKPFSKGQRARNCQLPLLVRFRTFCWGEITEELRNTYKLKELISPPVSAISPV
ncbi:MAG: hypothetical protein ACTSQG_10000, partial [Promethearchaeota archaeon]